MCENDIALFKRALVEGLSNKIDREISKCKEDIVVSPAHDRAMNEIITAAERKSSRSARFKKIIAILVAAALLLTGCAVIYRDEIRSFIEEIYETFVKVNYTDSTEDNEAIEDAYELSYLPDGYRLEKECLYSTKIKYKYKNPAGGIILYEQRKWDSLTFYADIENGYKKMLYGICSYDIYYKETKEHVSYIWNDGEYMFRMYFNEIISGEELKLIIEGIK